MERSYTRAQQRKDDGERADERIGGREGTSKRPPLHVYTLHTTKEGRARVRPFLGAGSAKKIWKEEANQGSVKAGQTWIGREGERGPRVKQKRGPTAWLKKKRNTGERQRRKSAAPDERTSEEGGPSSLLLFSQRPPSLRCAPSEIQMGLSDREGKSGAENETLWLFRRRTLSRWPRQRTVPTFLGETKLSWGKSEPCVFQSGVTVDRKVFKT